MGSAGRATTFTTRAVPGDSHYAISENRHLATHASSQAYEVTVRVADGGWSHEQTTMLRMTEFD